MKEGEREGERGAKGAQERRKKEGGKRNREGEGRREMNMCSCMPLLISDGSLPSSKKKEKERGRGRTGESVGEENSKPSVDRIKAAL